MDEYFISLIKKYHSTDFLPSILNIILVYYGGRDAYLFDLGSDFRSEFKDIIKK